MHHKFEQVLFIGAKALKPGRLSGLSSDADQSQLPVKYLPLPYDGDSFYQIVKGKSAKVFSRLL